MSRRNGRVWIKLLVAIVAIAGAGGAVYALLGTAATGGRGEATSELVPASLMDFEITVTATGDLRARNQIEIRNQLDSRTTITEIIEEGTTVEKGELLIRLNAEEIQAEVEEESLQVESARNELVAAENDYEIQVSENESRMRTAKLNLELAELAQKQYIKGDAEKRQTELTQRIDSARRNLGRLERKHEQNIELEKKGFISSDEFERGAIELEEARATLKIAELDLKIFNEYEKPRQLEQMRSDVAEAEAELERVARENEIQLASKEATRVNRRRQLAIREQRLKEDQRELEACTIRAPTDGLVVYGTSVDRDWRGDSTPLQIGTEVHSNQLLIVLPDTSEMMAEVRVPESIAGRVSKGQEARVKVDALGGEVFGGVVSSKGVLAESGGWRDPNSREYTVMIALDDSAAAHGRLKPSMRCEAEILLGRVNDALSVPIQAVFRDGPVQYVHRPTASGKYERVPVRIGRRSNSWAEIGVGLEAGDRVLVRRPRPGEVVQESWDAEELASVGLEMGKDGQPRRAGPPTGRPRGGDIVGDRGREGGPGERPAGGEGSAAGGEAPEETVAEAPEAGAGSGEEEASVEGASEAPPAGTE